MVQHLRTKHQGPWLDSNKGLTDVELWEKLKTEHGVRISPAWPAFQPVDPESKCLDVQGVSGNLQVHQLAKSLGLSELQIKASRNIARPRLARFLCRGGYVIMQPSSGPTEDVLWLLPVPYDAEGWLLWLQERIPGFRHNKPRYSGGIPAGFTFGEGGPRLRDEQTVAAFLGLARGSQVRHV